ncbi:MAG: putative integral rane protein [Actinomycetia bacterium]|nr:putative integral rane protein [Actinomycetes bacterium]
MSAIGSAVSLLSTMAVFWLAHVWSQITGERIYRGRRFTSELALAIARSEWPLVEAAFGPTVMLLLGWAGLFTDHVALTVALAICVVQLLGWGFVVGRRAYSRWYYGALSAVANGLLGFALVVLETNVLH